MLTIAFPAQAFDTNCYVLATQAGEECLVVDPGIGVEETLREVLTEHRLRPAPRCCSRTGTSTTSTR